MHRCDPHRQVRGSSAENTVTMMAGVSPKSTTASTRVLLKDLRVDDRKSTTSMPSGVSVRSTISMARSCHEPPVREIAAALAT
jgi:hypothetical protein